MKFYVETFGCQMNTADSQEMSRYLLARGFLPAQSAKDADCLLVNTCTVRQHAEDRALSYLGRLVDWQAEDRRRFLVVTGCAAERLGEKIRSRFPHVALVVGAKSINQFDALFDKTSGAAIDFNGRSESRDAWGETLSYDSLLPDETVTAFVTIMRGCNYSCSYCIVPSVRGREVYRPAKSVLS
jgi:tRNA-2-methylthio-N6-dimethylallyladenosine synthase